MRLRNSSPYPIVVMDPAGPFEVLPGATFEHDGPLAGLELVTEDRHEAPEPAPETAPAPVEPAAAPAPPPAPAPAPPVAPIPTPMPAPVAGVVIPPPPGAVTTTQ